MNKEQLKKLRKERNISKMNLESTLKKRLND